MVREDKNQRNTVDKEDFVKHTIKDSVFSDIFSMKKYLIQLYQAIHPEDKEAAENDLKNITIKNILTNGLYNDLGFQIGERVIILVESQSGWTMKIIVRALLYLAQTYQDYLDIQGQDLYGSKKVSLPRPELYVIYTGDHRDRPEYITLSEEFFGGAETSVEIKVRMLYGDNGDDIVGQYVAFTKVYDEQRKLYGRTRKAVTETIRICKDKNVLKEYLESRESEVVNIMLTLFDEEKIMRNYIRSEREEASVQSAIETYQEVGILFDDVVEKLMDRFGMSREKAVEEARQYWK